MTRLASKIVFILGVGILFPSCSARAQELTNPNPVKLEQKNLVRTHQAVKHLIGG